MSVGLVTFFKYKALGFYQRGQNYSEPLAMADLLQSIERWHSRQDSLPDTLPWCNEHEGYSHRKKVYLKAIKKNEETGDYIIVLWRAVGDGEGSVYGIRADNDLSSEEVVDTDDYVDGESVIWGEPAYYWFIPDHDIFASIKFGKSISDTKLLNRYFRDFVELRSDFRDKEESIERGTRGAYTKVTFNSEEGDNLWFRCYSERFTKITENADLETIAEEITHFVKREVISSSVPEDQSWARYFKALPFISKSETKDFRNIEVTVQAAPTARELAQVFNTYHEQYSNPADTWSNLGFQKGKGSTVWLDEFVVKTEFNVNDTGTNLNSGQYGPERLFNAMSFQRRTLLAPFASIEVDEVHDGTNG